MAHKITRAIYVGGHPSLKGEGALIRKIGDGLVKAQFDNRELRMPGEAARLGFEWRLFPEESFVTDEEITDA